MATHEFTPTHYHHAMGTYDPVLHIADGDTVATTTIDARGWDSNGERAAPGGNPQTGPFYVKGAEPGDTLHLRFDRLTPSRERGWTLSMLAPNVVDPDYVKNLPWPDPGEDSTAEWRIDTDAGTATLIKPDTKLGAIALPLAPFPGCFGVAPAGGEAISTATSGPHGGNMDYRGFVVGVDIYLPVSVPGALVFVGDGHALQGDGEIVGTGLEISFDVTFTANVIKGKKIRWPRGENGEYIFAVGNARPLDQAMQHATTEMARWLQEDYELDAVGSQILMGQCVEYDLGNMYDPAYTMVCKMPKRFLPSLA